MTILHAVTIFVSLVVLTSQITLLHQNKENKLAFLGHEAHVEVEDGSKWTMTDNGPIEQLTEADYQIFVTLLVTITAVLMGLGLELQLGNFWLGRLGTDLAAYWKLSEFMFPLMCTTAILGRSIFTLPFLVFGLWKFGFPETSMYIAQVAASYRLGTGKRGEIISALSDYLNALGLLLHHSASAYVVSALAIQAWPLTRQLGSVLLPLVIQHWFCLLKYQSEDAYSVVEIILEILWEWEWFSNFQHFCDANTYDKFAPAIAMQMLLAHWCYLIGAFLLMVHPHTIESGDESDDEGTINRLECTVNRLECTLHRLVTTKVLFILHTPTSNSVTVTVLPIFCKSRCARSPILLSFNGPHSTPSLLLAL
jgi:hypothetical protein